MIKILLALLVMVLPLQVKALAIQTDRFANAAVIAAPGTVTTKWFDIRHMHYVDFTIVATAGDGTIDVEYASDPAGTSLIADTTIAAFDSTQAATLYAAGVGKFYIRLNINCVTAPCNYSAWYTAKGMM